MKNGMDGLRDFFRDRLSIAGFGYRFFTRFR